MEKKLSKLTDQARAVVMCLHSEWHAAVFNTIQQAASVVTLATDQCLYKYLQSQTSLTT